MKRLTGGLLTSYLINTLFVSLLFFLATYFFIGKNIDYMAKTQQQINEEFLNRIDFVLAEKDVDNGGIDELLVYASFHNLGFELQFPDGRTISGELREPQLLLKMEFGGKLVKEKVDLESGGGALRLTYFKPYFYEDNTAKFYPAFIRLILIFLASAIPIVLFSSLKTVLTLKSDIKKINDLASNLVKGSNHNLSGDPNFIELKELQKKITSIRQVILNKEDLQKRMTADFAHELRTPLTTLQTHLEALIDGVWKPSKERFISCHEEILRLIRLVGDLEKLYKFEEGSVSLNKSSFDLTELIKIISMNFDGEFKKGNIDFTLMGDHQYITADKDKISQVVVNLISNSLKYSSQGGKVFIDVRGDNEYVYLVVNDSGVGIPNKDIAHVFNRLYRSDISRTRESGGAGIGLTIAKSVITAHKGSIDIVSQEGVGTEVTVILPRV